MEGRTKLLLGILGLLVAIAVWHYLAPDSGAAIVGGTGGAPAGIPLRGSRQAAKPPVEFVEELRVADLTARPHTYTPGRDPWRFFDPPPPPPPAPPQPSAAELERRRLEQERLAAERAQRLAQQRAEDAKPKPPPFTLSCLGTFGPEDKHLAVFTDGKTIYNAQEGEVIDGKFIVAHIGYESVDIKFVNFPTWPAQRVRIGRTTTL
jgi:hypothetical protein